MNVMQHHGCPTGTLAVRLSGFIFTHKKDASPDGIVIDSSDNSCKHLIEVKCPYIKCDMSPEEACKHSNFYCYISDNGTFTLKRSHRYYSYSCMYHQICVNDVTSVPKLPRVSW